MNCKRLLQKCTSNASGDAYTNHEVKDRINVCPLGEDEYHKAIKRLATQQLDRYHYFYDRQLLECKPIQNIESIIHEFSKSSIASYDLCKKIQCIVRSYITTSKTESMLFDLNVLKPHILDTLYLLTKSEDNSSYIYTGTDDLTRKLIFKYEVNEEVVNEKKRGNQGRKRRQLKSESENDDDDIVFFMNKNQSNKLKLKDQKMRSTTPSFDKTPSPNLNNKSRSFSPDMNRFTPSLMSIDDQSDYEDQSEESESSSSESEESDSESDSSSSYEEDDETHEDNAKYTQSIKKNKQSSSESEESESSSSESEESESSSSESEEEEKEYQKDYKLSKDGSRVHLLLNELLVGTILNDLRQECINFAFVFGGMVVNINKRNTKLLKDRLIVPSVQKNAALCIMENVGTMDLLQYIESSRSNTKDLHQILTQVVDALCLAQHKHKFIHGDLHTENVRLNHDLVVQMIDFGESIVQIPGTDKFLFPMQKNQCAGDNHLTRTDQIENLIMEGYFLSSFDILRLLLDIKGLCRRRSDILVLVNKCLQWFVDDIHPDYLMNYKSMYPKNAPRTKEQTVQFLEQCLIGDYNKFDGDCKQYLVTKQLVHLTTKDMNKFAVHLKNIQV